MPTARFFQSTFDMSAFYNGTYMWGKKTVSQVLFQLLHHKTTRVEAKQFTYTTVKTLKCCFSHKKVRVQHPFLKWLLILYFADKDKLSIKLIKMIFQKNEWIAEINMATVLMSHTLGVAMVSQPLDNINPVTFIMWDGMDMLRECTKQNYKICGRRWS